MKRRFLSVVFALMTLFSMVFIYYNSSMTAEESNSISKSMAWEISDYVTEKAEKAHAGGGAENTGQPLVSTAPSTAVIDGNKLNAPLRRAAHALEFVLLGFSLAGLLLSLLTPERFRRCAALAWIGCGLYALTDELHQLFVDGRAFEVSDLLLDGIGSMAGILLCVCLTLVFVRKR